MIKLNRKECPNPNALSTDYKNKENKEALKQSSFGKCMYCESKISHIDYGDVEHIKPKKNYPNLKFTWNNLGISCTKCNREYKHDKYDESTPYIDPFSENPSEHLRVFGSFLFSEKGSERGEMTIKDIGLNRVGLLEKRTAKINTIDKTIKACYRTASEDLRKSALDSLKVEADDDKEYALTVKTFLNSLLP